MNDDKFLLFSDFIAYLKRQGFVIGVEHYLRLQTILSTCNAINNPKSLKTLLCPIFATSSHQQRLFYQAFDFFFSSHGEDGEIETTPEITQEKKRGYIWLALFLVSIVIAGLIYWKYYYTPDTQIIVPPKPSTGEDIATTGA